MVPQTPLDVVQEKLLEIENDYNAGDLTRKGYCNKKWTLLEPHASDHVLKEVEKLKCRLQVDLSVDIYCNEMLELMTKVLVAQTNGNMKKHDDENGNGVSETNGKNGHSDMYVQSDSDDESPAITSPIKPQSPKKLETPKIVLRTPLVEKEATSGKQSNSKGQVSDEPDEVKVEDDAKEKKIKGKNDAKVEERIDDQSNKDDECDDDDKQDSDSDGDKRLSSRLSGIKENNESLSPIPGPSNKTGRFAKKSLSTGKSKKKPEGRSAGNRKSLTSYFTQEDPKSKEEKAIKEEPKELEEEKVQPEEPMEEDMPVKEEIKEEEEEEEDPDVKPAKRVKTESDEKEAKLLKKKKSLGTEPKKCETCHQLLEDPDLRLYVGHPHNAVEEFVALTDQRLNVFTGEEDDVHEDDMRPSVKVTQFTVYDKEGHLCPIDSDLIERNVLLHFSGYMKPIFEEDPTAEGGVPAKDVGPINEWWVCGYDGGERAIVGFSTGYAEYYLMEPSEQYAPLVESLNQKIYMGKIVIEFLLESENPSYEDLLDHIQNSVPPTSISQMTEDVLLKHSQFICDQVASFDAASPGEEDPLIATPCMRALIHYAGVTFGKRQLLRRGEKKQFKDKKPRWTKATTTPLVKDVFEMFFSDQIADNDAHLAMRKKRCGICEACQLPDCGSCRNCLSMVKFSGNGKLKQACIKRKCPNIAVAEAEESDPDDEDEYEAAAEKKGSNRYVTMRSERSGSGNKKVTWIGDSIKDDGKRIFYNSALVGDEEFTVGDCVSVEPANLTSPVVIGKISFMWENSAGQKYMHVSWFCRSSETVLGETGDNAELFQINECENTLLNGIKSKVTVTHWPVQSTWAEEGGKPLAPNPSSLSDDPDRNFYYRFRYCEKYGRFEDVLPDPVCRSENTMHRFCASCERQYQEEKFNTPFADEKLEEVGPKNETMYGVVRWKGEEFRPGTCVFLQPTVFNFKQYGLVFTAENRKSDDVDEEMYPEYYRKASDYVRGSNEETPQPFCIGLITSIVTNSKDKIVVPSDICLRVIKFYRPENTVGVTMRYDQFDLNMLYSSEEEKLVNFLDVAGKCYVVYGENLIDVAAWSRGGPNRFYFTEGYSPKTKSIIEPSKTVKLLGDVGKGGSKGKGKSSATPKKREEAEMWSKISQPLKCLDVFAGCGGLSEGLHQSGVAETKWAIEKEEDAAHAFRLNNPSAVVFSDDCNTLLKMALQGETKIKGQKLPQRGEVELIVGGPPCQGFSGMNRFNQQQYSLFKNSLIVSYLAYCDYYRPKFFILENVRNFVSFKNCMVLKLTLRCLIKMGYQVTFGVLQAGHYGVPQSRRRAIIMAAAPGQILPKYPEPTHTFNPRVSKLSVMVDDRKFTTNCSWEESAPFRTVTVSDAMSDLPEISNGASKEEIPYNGDPRTHFQKLMRGDQYQSMVRDHICKEMAPIVTARIAHIPTASGSDWRDLPNVCVLLSNDVTTKKLQYTHHDKRNGRSSTGALRGVCACASGKACDPMDRQFNTLIPWCLPHTGNRHNNWAGLYGRLEWEGYFSTTVTNPEPMGKQGRVLHPEQTRVVSVKECARSQGFPDKYRFYGNILAKHRQIGNAVPPPMGCAIGREIIKSVCAVDTKMDES